MRPYNRFQNKQQAKAAVITNNDLLDNLEEDIQAHEIRFDRVRGEEDLSRTTYFEEFVLEEERYLVEEAGYSDEEAARAALSIADKEFEYF